MTPWERLLIIFYNYSSYFSNGMHSLFIRQGLLPRLAHGFFFILDIFKRNIFREFIFKLGARSSPSLTEIRFIRSLISFEFFDARHCTFYEELICYKIRLPFDAFYFIVKLLNEIHLS